MNDEIKRLTEKEFGPDDKVCPVISRAQAFSGGQGLAPNEMVVVVKPLIVACMRDRCALWSDEFNACRLGVIARTLIED